MAKRRRQSISLHGARHVDQPAENVLSCSVCGKVGPATKCENCVRVQYLLRVGAAKYLHEKRIALSLVDDVMERLRDEEN